MSTDLPTPARRYSDREVRRLLQQAAEIQKKETGHDYGDDGGGLTLADLQEIAAEAGIHPRFLQQAAASIDSPKATGLGPMLAGSALNISVERNVPGELGEEEFERAIVDIQHAFKEPGTASMVGRTLMWKTEATDTQRALQVTVSSRSGETHIRAAEQLKVLAAGLYIGVVGGVGTGVGFGVGLPVGLSVLASPLFAALFPVGIIGGLYAGMRAVLKRTAARRRRELERTADRIAGYARISASPQDASGQGALPPGAAELPG